MQLSHWPGLVSPQVHLCRRKVAGRSCHFYNSVEGEGAHRRPLSLSEHAAGRGLWVPPRVRLGGLLCGGAWALFHDIGEGAPHRAEGLGFREGPCHAQ